MRCGVVFIGLRLAVGDNPGFVKDPDENVRAECHVSQDVRSSASSICADPIRRDVLRTSATGCHLPLATRLLTPTPIYVCIWLATIGMAVCFYCYSNLPETRLIIRKLEIWISDPHLHLGASRPSTTSALHRRLTTQALVCAPIPGTPIQCVAQDASQNLLWNGRV